MGFRDECAGCDKSLEKVFQYVNGHLVESKKYVQCKNCDLFYLKKEGWHVKGSIEKELGLSEKELEK